MRVSILLLTACLCLPTADRARAENARRKTEVAIQGDRFFINGQPTYRGRMWQGKRIEGLLFNSRMVQATFDDLNPKTRELWAYPDTGRWDPERNTREFLAAMPGWRKHGLLGMTLNLQGGSPKGYSAQQPWHNSALTEEGKLRPDYMARLERVLDRADELGMVVILGIFYFGQDERFKDEAAVIAGLDNAIDWLFDKGYRNILIEINNECNVRYDHAILKPARVHELIERVKKRKRDGRRFLVSTSYGGGTIPGANVVRASDFLLLHGNGVSDPDKIADMVKKTRQVPGYRPMPILFNEDDHFAFDQPKNNLLAAVGEYASWGFFDYRMKGEGFDDGYQSVPVNWGAQSARKRGFFNKVKEITGEAGEPAPKSSTKEELPAGAIARLGSLAFRHAGPVTSLAFTPDGATLVSAGGDQHVRSWNIADGLELQPIRTAAAVLAINKKGDRLATGGANRSVRVWDRATGKMLWEQKEGLNAVRSVAFSPDGLTVATGDSDGTIVLSASDSGKELRRWVAHAGWVSALSFSRDGKRLASGGQDFLAKIWDMPSGKLERTLEGHGEWVWSLSFAHKSDTLATGSWDGTIRLWDANTGTVKRRIVASSSRVYAVAFSPDDRYLGSGGDDSRLSLWETESAKNLFDMPAGAWIHAVAFSPDGKKFVCASDDHTVHVHDVPKGGRLQYAAGAGMLATLGPARALSFSAENDHLLCACRFEPGKWNFTSGDSAPIWSKRDWFFGGQPPDFTWTIADQGRRIARGDQRGTVYWSTFGGMHRPSTTHADCVSALSIFADGNLLASASWDGTTILWDMERNNQLHVLKGHSGWVTAVAFAQSGKLLATGGADKTIRLWNPSDGKQVRELSGNASWVRALAFSPTDAILASASPDRTVRFWDVTNGKELRRIDGHHVLDLAFSPDGRLLATAGKDQTVRLWDVATAKERHRFEGHRGPVHRLAFSADGTLLASASQDTTVVVWRCPTIN